MWRVPRTTHCKLLPHLANCMDIKLWFSRRCMKFIKMATINSSNIVVKTIPNMGIYGLHSVMGANKRFPQSIFYMEEMNVYEMWKHQVNSDDEVRMSVQLRELCECRDKCDYIFLTKNECQTIINDLCTN